MTLETMIRRLSHSEKLAAMDLLWRELSATPSEYVSPEWHQRIIDARLASPAPGEPLPLDEARAEVMDSFNARRTQT